MSALISLDDVTAASFVCWRVLALGAILTWNAFCISAYFCFSARVPVLFCFIKFDHTIRIIVQWQTILAVQENYILTSISFPYNLEHPICFSELLSRMNVFSINTFFWIGVPNPGYKGVFFFYLFSMNCFADMKIAKWGANRDLVGKKVKLKKVFYLELLFLQNVIGLDSIEIILPAKADTLEILIGISPIK